MDKRPNVGVAAIIKEDGKILLGERKGAHAVGDWAFPGGHLEFNESFNECVKREVLEETGLSVTKITLALFTNDMFTIDNKHYVTLFFYAQTEEGESELREPDKCEEWRWFDPINLPEPLMLPIRNALSDGFTF